MKTKVLVLFLLSIVTLTACGKSETEPAEQVIQKFKENVKEIEAAEFSASLKLSGQETEDNVDLSIAADVKIDRTDDTELKADLSLEVEGSFAAGDQILNGSAAIKIVTIGKEFYFNLESLDTNDPKFEFIKPMIETYQKKWLQVPSDFLPPEIRQLQEKDEDALAKEEAMKDLFVDTKLFEVSKEFGAETLNGVKVNHYGLKPDKEGFRTYLRKAAVINESEVTDAELEEFTSFVDGIKSIEVWIGAKDYYLYKAIANILDENTDQGTQANVSITFAAKSYNQDLKIEAPEGAEEFNPLSLLLGAPSLNMPTGDIAEGLELPEGLDLSDLEG